MSAHPQEPDGDVAVAIAVALAIHAARVRATSDAVSTRPSAWLRSTRVADGWAAGQTSGWTSPTVASVSRYPD